MRPPSAAAGSQTFHLRKTTNAAIAETGMPSTIKRFALTIGLSTGAKGALIRPSKGLEVFGARFTPVGTKRELLKNGLRPWSARGAPS